jgi:hypothetical protein
MYAPHEASPVAMTVKVDAGRFIKSDYTVVTNAQQTGTITTAHATLPRIDRVVIDGVTGTVSVIAGTPNASPTAPAITAGKLPVCQVYVAAAVTTISNSVLTDERAFMANFASLLTQANTWLADQTISTTAPRLILSESDAAADNKKWDILASGEALSIRAVNDADTGVNAITVQRTGNTVDSVTVGGTTAILTGGQLKFPATQIPSGDANTLDDYEIGTFSVTAQAATSGTITLNSLTNYYVKIGKLVTVVVIVDVASVSSPVGILNILGLPFTAVTPCAAAIHGNGLTGLTTESLQASVQGNVIRVTTFLNGVVGVAADNMTAGSVLYLAATFYST